MKLLPLSQSPETLSLWADHPLAALLKFPLPVARENWVLLDDGGSLRGRIGASLSLSFPGKGYVGYFDLKDPSDSEASRLLLDEACRFLKQAGASEAIGPMHLNTWLPYRFSIGGNSRFGWEPRNPGEYPELWRQSGFERLALYASQGHSGLSQLVGAMKPAWEKVLQSGYRFRPIDADQLLGRELTILHSLSMQGFADNFLFEPLPEALFRELYVPLAGKNARQNLSLSAFVLSPEGHEVGFSFSFVDPSHGKPRVVLKTATLLPKHRGKGLSNALFYETLSRLDPALHDEFIGALVRDGAQSESYGRHCPMLWRQEYELLHRKL